MPKHTGLVRNLTLLVALSTLSCSSNCGSENDQVPREVDSGFVFQEDAFPFENYGGDGVGPQLTPKLVARMFGPESVCIGGTIPCELTPVANAWMQATNGTLHEGRSEGFAVTSLMFHAGELDPNDFGAETVGQLRLFGNRALQEEIAYWAATQSVPSAVEGDKRYQANKVLGFLADALDPGSDTHYRLAIAQRTDTGFARGHAVTPIGYYKGEGDVYWLRVYDNNFPDKERRIEINPEANTWRYEVPPLDDGEPIVYEGNATNGNHLYFSPVQGRLGVLQAPFAPDSEVRTISYSSVQIVATRDGRETGIRDGEILEDGDDRVVPTFSACPRCGADVPVINQTLIDRGVTRPGVIQISAQGEVRTDQGTGGTGDRVSRQIGQSPGDGNIDWISATGADFTTTVKPQGDISKDSVTFGEGGSTTYDARSGNGVSIESYSVVDGVQEAYKVSVEGSGDADVEVTVTISTDENGQKVIEVENLPAGKTVTVEIGRVALDGSSRNTETVTFTSTGDTSRTTLDPADDKIAVSGGDEVTGGSCTNGLKDTFETDVDCGGECSACPDGRVCSVSADCTGDCVDQGGTKVCQSQQCSDMVQNGDETDVDCGGDLCGTCTATIDQRTTPMCDDADDCDSGMCVDGRCRLPQPVVIRANRLPQDGVAMQFLLDDRLRSYRAEAATLEGPHEFVIGTAYTFKVNSVSACTTDFTTQVTGQTADGDTEPRGIIELDCPPAGSITVSANHVNQSGIAPIPVADPLVLEWIIDGVRNEVNISGDTGMKPVGVFANSWEVRIISHPLGAVENPRSPGQMGSYFCRISPWTLSSPNRRSDTIDDASIFCKWVAQATCSDNIKNQNESGVDCGGVCNACPQNGSCNYTTDCVSPYACVGGTCLLDGDCNDSTQNQDETDVDCGGSICGACSDSQSCAVASDCVSSNCSANVCQAATCSDAITNQNESDVDCGGACSGCALGATCNTATDCSAADCVASVCTESCSDGVTNQDETGTDCGGTICSGCPDGQACQDGSDCTSNYCLNATCATASCTDGVQNQDETDIDCGGTSCAGCADSGACNVATDCASNYCVANVCTTATCSDGITNQDESDVDCGGTTCGGCTDGRSCNANADCSSNQCTGGQCVASCSDGIQNQDETGIDCGGTVCGPCGTGSACTLDTDCSTDSCECGPSSGNCANNSGRCSAGKLIADLPTTDGVAASGTFTVPAQCAQVYVQAWGAAGGAGGSGGGMMVPGTPGGAGGYVSGTLNVAQGDVIDVWVGQGGDFGVVYDFGGQPSIGSKYGVRTDGGLGDGDSFTGGGGGGGGLTSVRVSGSAIQQFLLPAGGGGTSFGAGDDVSSTGGGGAVGSAGEDAPIASMEAGGGAGEVGGSYLGSSGGGAAGTYGTYPAGFTTADGLSGTPANTTAPDYSLCQGIGMGSVGAGSNTVGSMWNAGGDGCVVLRCVGQ